MEASRSQSHFLYISYFTSFPKAVNFVQHAGLYHDVFLHRQREVLLLNIQKYI